MFSNVLFFIYLSIYLILSKDIFIDFRKRGKEGGRRRERKRERDGNI